MFQNLFDNFHFRLVIAKAHSDPHIVHITIASKTTCIKPLQFGINVLRVDDYFALLRFFVFLNLRTAVFPVDGNVIMRVVKIYVSHGKIPCGCVVVGERSVARGGEMLIFLDGEFVG